MAERLAWLRSGLIVSSMVALAACSGSPGRPDYGRYDRLMKPIAQPGQVVAAEIAFAQLAREKGQWTAFREYAAEDAIMFVPQVVNAQQWLKGRVDPAQSVRWQPHEIWSSCDGSLSVSYGALQRPDGSTGWFNTVWVRQDDGSYRWVMDQGGESAEPVPAPDIIATHVASCDGAKPRATQPPARPGAPYGISRDGTLRWDVLVAEVCARTVSIRMKQGEEWGDPVFNRTIAAPGGADCAA